jgi:hypothetical protein
VSASITGLVASTTYHFRIVATNSGGTSIATGETFKTPAIPPASETSKHETTPSSPEQEIGATMEIEEEAAPKTGVLGAKEAMPNATLADRYLTAGPEGMISVGVRCPAGTVSCTGTITLKTLNAISTATAHQPQKRKAVILTLAAGSFKVTGGQLVTIKLRLSPRARALLARTYVLRARATIVAHDPTGATRTSQTIITIRAAKARHG